MKKKILVIDDDLNIREYLVSLFKDNGYEVYVAGDVKQGLSQTKKNKPHLITLDIEMPGEWGPRFYHQLTQDPELKDIPVIVISGLSGHQCAVVKAVASISKPFDRDELLKIVKETLKK
ncbi:MAG: response regulator [Proteobacteria bacterium]|nr:response regulator [Pseudomonadota bacterium]MBU1585319.1 response regulator [Pseudomonadota bacterium]MBU2456195.1 response regulator [Pseudomonadota bacterium]MBU2627992.1 response regulator [Pseudomonadota bacterium]